MTCAEKTYDKVRPQVRAAIDRAKAGQQTAAALVIAMPARAH